MQVCMQLCPCRLLLSLRLKAHCCPLVVISQEGIGFGHYFLWAPDTVPQKVGEMKSVFKKNLIYISKLNR